MTGEQLFLAFGQLDDDLLERSEAALSEVEAWESIFTAEGELHKKRLTRIVRRCGACAAGILLIGAGVFAGWRFLGPRLDSAGEEESANHQDIVSYAVKEPEEGKTTLQSLTLPELSIDGMGMEALMYPDITLEDNGNPWADAELPDALPVYRNTGVNPFGMALALTEEEMMELLQETAEALAVEVGEIEYSRVGNGLPPDADISPDAVMMLQTKTEEVRIEVDGTGTVTVHFIGGLALPEEFHFTHTDTTDEEAEAVLAYLIEEYRELLWFEEPVPVLSGSYRITGEYSRDYQVYDGGGSHATDMVNYSFNYAEFAPNDDGELMLIRMCHQTEAAELVGEYPLISADEAKALLRDGHYQSSVHSDYIGGAPRINEIAKTELVYRTGRREELWIPYYRFYLPITEILNTPEGLTSYGAFYVPAIPEQYFTNTDIYDGSFN